MQKTMLVVGSAPGVFQDVERALILRPAAELFLVNGAATLFERAAHVLAGHAEKSELFASARHWKFPNAPPWELHAVSPPMRLKVNRSLYPSVDVWHAPEMGARSSSCATAAKIALTFCDEVIFCGSPLDGSG